MDACSSYIICSTQRSGSTLLCDGLISTGVAGRPAEYFNVGPGDTDHQQPPWKDDLRTKPLAEYLPVALRHGTTENGVFGLKLHWIQLQMLERNLVAMQGGNASLAERLARAFPQPRYIWMTRRDKVRQAVSLFKAKQSHSWHSSGRGHSDGLAFDYQLVDSALRQIVQQEAAWAGFFDEAGIVPHTVVYEDLVMAYEETIHGVL
ncbi:MAG TPA: Stf0 family sulfotransferase, partial [Chloroflexota bacterium]|nr:Stf0 family sulfotransferase [Chloroflexota bacterium]